MKHIFLLDLSQIVIAQFTAHKGLILIIVLGLIAGLIAQLIVPGRGFGLIATAAIGIASCYIGRLYVMKYITFIENAIAKQLVAAIIVAMAISLLINLVRPRERVTTKHR